jgi:hypothetical protein
MVENQAMNIRVMEIVVCKQESVRNNFITPAVISNIHVSAVHVLKVPR